MKNILENRILISPSADSYKRRFSTQPVHLLLKIFPGTSFFHAEASDASRYYLVYSRYYIFLDNQNRIPYIHF